MIKIKTIAKKMLCFYRQKNENFEKNIVMKKKISLRKQICDKKNEKKNSSL